MPPDRPKLKYDQLIGVESTLKDLELLAAGLLLHGAAALGHGLGEPAFPGWRTW